MKLPVLLYFLSMVLFFSSSKSVRADLVLIPTSKEEVFSKVSPVSEEMGLEKISVRGENKTYDGLQYSMREEKGLQSFLLARKQFPRFVSVEIENYILAFAESFTQTLPLPQPRFRFYLANTINPALWSLGGGFYIIHAGFLHFLTHPSELAFCVLLEMAHEALSHSTINLKENAIKGFELNRWAVEAIPDPIISSKLVYSFGQEKQALELVQTYFDRFGMDVLSIGKKVLEKTDQLAANEPEKSSFYFLHQNLRQALNNLKPHPLQAIPSKLKWDTDFQKKLFVKLQYYPWLFFEHSNTWAKEYFKATSLYQKQDWKNLLKLTRRFFEANSTNVFALSEVQLKDATIVKNNKAAEPFQDLHVQALQMNEKFQECIHFLKTPWPYYDHLRELHLIECVFLDGFITEASVLAKKYTLKYPNDLEGMFWRNLIAFHMREEDEKSMKTILAFWGDRPMVRALRALSFGVHRKYSLASEQFQFSSEIAYSFTESGIYEFANSWVRRSFTVFHDQDSTSQDLNFSAQKHWPISLLLQSRFPRLND